MALSDRPLLTSLSASWGEFRLRSDSVFISRSSVEERSLHPAAWEEQQTGTRFIRVTSEGVSSCSVESSEGAHELPLRSASQLGSFFSSLRATVVYLDITGLSHHVWAPLIRSALAGRHQLYAVYAEPADYRFRDIPLEGQIFDLSEQITGIAPVPGFSTFSEPSTEDGVCFVPLLGFEGLRLAYVLEQVQPPGDKVVPVVGVPGFRPEYPFYAFHGNQNVFGHRKFWKRVRFARANCPFSLYYALLDVARDFEGDLLKVAPIGTKPHALGAVLFALLSSRPVELVYDHPIRKAARTAGVANILSYDLTSFHQGS